MMLIHYNGCYMEVSKEEIAYMKSKDVKFYILDKHLRIAKEVDIMVELKPNGDGYKAVSDYLDEHFFNKVPKQFYPDWGPDPYIYLVNVECSNAGDCLTKMWYEMDYDTNKMTCHWEDDWWEGGDVKLWGIIPEKDVLDMVQNGLDNVNPNGVETHIYLHDDVIDILERYKR